MSTMRSILSIKLLFICQLVLAQVDPQTNETKYDSLRKLGDSVRHQGHYDKAIIIGRQMQDLYPNRYWHGLGQAYANLGFPELAEESIAMTVPKNRVFPKAHCLLMRFARKAGNRKEVLRHYLAAKASWSEEPEEAASLWNCQYQALTYLGNYEEGKNYLNQAAKLIPEKQQSISFQIARAFLAFKTGETEQAYQYLDIAQAHAEEKMSKQTEVSGAHFDLLEIYALRGDYETALNLLREIRGYPYRDYLWLKVNPETQDFTRHPEVKKIMADMKKEMDSMKKAVIPFVFIKEK